MPTVLPLQGDNLSFALTLSNQVYFNILKAMMFITMEILIDSIVLILISSRHRRMCSQLALVIIES